MDAEEVDGFNFTRLIWMCQKVLQPLRGQVLGLGWLQGLFQARCELPDLLADVFLPRLEALLASEEWSISQHDSGS